VIAFEPNPRSLSRLVRATSAVRDLTAVEAAVGAKEGTATLYEPEADDELSEVASLVPRQGAGTVAVRVVTLDSQLADEHRVRLLKIDTEGYELEVLRGGHALLESRRADALLVELNPQALRDAGASAAEVVSALHAYGYEAERVFVADREEAWIDVDRLTEGFCDVVFSLREPRDSPELTVVVPACRAGGQIRRHLPSFVAALTALGVHWDGVVVDDGSPTDEVLVSDLPHPFRLVRLPHNSGASAARNAGARRSCGDWLLFVDSDVELDAESLRAIWQGRRPDTCLVPEVRNAIGVLENAVTRSRALWEPRWVYHATPVEEVDFPLGACFFLHRDLFERAGGMDERFLPNYFEDTALGDRLRRAGACTRMVDGAVARHYGWGAPDDLDKIGSVRRTVDRNRWRYLFGYTRGAERLSLVLAPVRALRASLSLRSIQPTRDLVAVAFERIERRAAGYWHG
jgi:FkbM family methyltransferase